MRCCASACGPMCWRRGHRGEPGGACHSYLCPRQYRRAGFFAVVANRRCAGMEWHQRGVARAASRRHRQSQARDLRAHRSDSLCPETLPSPPEELARRLPSWRAPDRTAAPQRCSMRPPMRSSFRCSPQCSVPSSVTGAMAGFSFPTHSTPGTPRRVLGSKANARTPVRRRSSRRCAAWNG